MAESTDNVVMYGMKGLIGNLIVFKRFFGKTIVARRPRKSEVEPTADQLAVQSRFKLAAAYAKSVISDPIRKASYEALTKPGQTAYNMAFADYYRVPEMSDPEVSAYTGVAGQKISVRATDIFKVVGVAVRIEQADGTLVETGNAVLSGNGIEWEYVTTSLNDALSGSKIRFTASDVPGNQSVLEVSIP